MGRPKKNPNYDPDRARDELVKAVSDYYLNPQSEGMKGRDGKTRMKNMELEFGLSMGKIRKLLVTGGVYSFEKDGVELVSEIARLRDEGLSDEEIIFNTSSPIAKGEGKILVPRSMLASYKADSAWGAYSAVIYAIEDYPELAE